jgi:heptosyltransferase-3
MTTTADITNDADGKRSGRAKLALPERPRILVVALRRIGDVLLTTPLIRSLRHAWPDAEIDVMVYGSTASILAGNPDITRTLTVPERPSREETRILTQSLRKQYDLAITTQPGDRPTTYAWIAGRKRAGVTGPGFNGLVKRLLLHRSARANSNIHRVEEAMTLARALGIAPSDTVVPPAARDMAAALPAAPYAVLHAAPMFRYKQWTREGWLALAAALSARGMTVVATGGPGAEERSYLDKLWRDAPVPVLRVPPEPGWSTMTALLARASLYVGPDTSVTHLAAALGIPTVALFGPTDPRRWGPWPVGGMSEPWATRAPVQRRGNVWLVQNVMVCTPCNAEGCLRRLDSHSQCLDEMTLPQVLAAVDAALAAPRERATP